MAELTSRHPLLPITGKPWPRVHYGCTTRAGGVSDGAWASLNLAMHVGDDRESVVENRRRLAAELPAEPLWLDQIHGTRVVDADALSALLPRHHRPTAGNATVAESEVAPRGDAAVTTRPDVVLAIMTADCVPVVIADLEGRGLGVAHAGWRGLAAGVLDTTLTALRAKLPDATGWRAWVGPCIGQDRFEVGEEVRAAFADIDSSTARFFQAGAPGKWQANLSGLARDRLEKIGVRGVEQSSLCTYDDADQLYSYRRSAVTGRMATLAWLHRYQA